MISVCQALFGVSVNSPVFDKCTYGLYFRLWPGVLRHWSLSAFFIHPCIVGSEVLQGVQWMFTGVGYRNGSDFIDGAHAPRTGQIHNGSLWWEQEVDHRSEEAVPTRQRCLSSFNGGKANLILLQDGLKIERRNNWMPMHEIKVNALQLFTKTLPCRHPGQGSHFLS